MVKDSEIFVDNMLQQLPSLKTVYDEHIDKNDSLLPHVFMGDLTRFVISESENVESRTTLTTLMRYLDDGLRTGSDEVKELIVVSFVENLLGEVAALRSLKPLMGPRLRSEVEQICG